MADEGFKRKLAAILSADVEGYSRLMDDDEEATVRTLTSYRTAIADLVQQFRGRVVDTPGDNILTEFTSVVDAVNCAVEIQRELAERNAELSYNRQMQFRIGVNLGDVIEEDGRIYGDGVNIAARVESVAEAGGICISGRAHDQVENKLGLEYEDLGKHEVKNISRPIQVYRVLSHPGAAAHRVLQAKTNLGRRWRKIGLSAAAVVLVVAALGIWQFYMRRPTVETASVEKMAFPLPEKPSIAVLPFDNMSGDPQQEYFSDGITEDIITALSKTDQIFVIARNSTFTYKGKPVKVKQVAEELGVRYVLEGSVRKTEDRVRITAQLIDATTGHHLWAENYDRDLKNIFALQDEITLKVVNALQIELTEGEEARMWGKKYNLDVYLKYMELRTLWRKGTKESLTRSGQLSQEIIDMAPESPVGHRNLALYYRQLAARGKSPRENMKKALELAQKALSLDESDAMSHSLLGFVYSRMGQYEKAIAAGERSIELAPNGATYHVFFGQTLCFAGKIDEGIAQLNQGIRLNPFPPYTYFLNLGICNVQKGQYEKALPEFKKALQRSPDNIFNNILIAANYALLDRQAEAEAAAQKALEIKPNFSIERFTKGWRYMDPAYLKLIFDAMHKAGLPYKPPLPLPDKPSIAVLAFDNMSGDPEQEYFSDGITDDIITALSKTPKMFVIARNSSFTYKDKQVKVQEVGRDLGVRYVLEGSVRKVGEKVRITAQLIDAKTGHHLWAEKYDRDLKDIFALQDEITKRIITALEVKLTEGEQAAIHAKGTGNLEVYLKCLEARELIRHHNIKDNRKARRLLVKVIEIDPNYAQAYRLSSSSHFMDVLLGTSKSPGDSLKRAIELSKKAISLDNSLAGAHGTLGFIYVIITKQYEKGMAELEIAVELEPNGADVHGYLGTGLLYTDKLDEGILITKKAIRLNPIAPSWYLNILAALYRSKGNYKEALVWSEKAVKQEPENTIARVNLSSIYYLSGRTEDAHLQANEVMKLNPKFSLKRLEKTLGYKNPEVKKQYIDALRNAGLPE